MTSKIYLYLSLLVILDYAFSANIPYKIYRNAQENIGETVWAKEVDRQAKRNEHVFVTKGEWKCNLFVYEIILASGYDIGTPNKVNCVRHPVLCLENKDKRPPCCKDWFDETVPGFYLIGENDEGRSLCQEGDILTDGNHIGIVSNPEDGLTISAYREEVVESNFGFSNDDKKNTFKIFRYNGDSSTNSQKSSTKEFQSTGNGKYLPKHIIMLILFLLI
jgi:hypothetical protein